MNNQKQFIQGQTLQWSKDKRNMKTKTMVDKILQI